MMIPGSSSSFELFPEVDDYEMHKKPTIKKQDVQTWKMCLKKSNCIVLDK